MKIIKYLFITISLMVTITACEDFLSVSPKGVLTEDQLTDPKYIDGFVTAAYAAMLLNISTQSTQYFIEGGIRAGDSYKGGGSLEEQPGWTEMTLFTPVNIFFNYINWFWTEGYSGISRCNTALHALNNVSEDVFPEKTVRIAEMRFLRGVYYFKLKILFKWIPWIDEDLPSAEYENISNHPSDAVNDLGIWQNIYNDFKFAAENLPTEQEDIGRCNKYAAEGLLIKTLLFMAYEQDVNNHVVNINTEKLNEALDYCDDIINSGRYDLCTDFAENFLPEYDNSTPESLWELQFSIDDGTSVGRLDFGNGLSAPAWGTYFPCCDFHKPSHNLVNAFRTDANGLPLFDTYNNEEITGNTNYFPGNTFDPRLSHTVAIPGYPWKYDPELLYDSTGSKAPQIFGYFNSLKENVSPDCSCVYKSDEVANSMNKRVVRYDEILLWKAEALIQLGRHMEALPIINQVRQRAANSIDRLKFADDSYLLNYNVGLYENGVNCNWDQDFAFQALVWENRLETACEGRRFFDLVRWGIAEDVVDAYFSKEGQRFSWLGEGNFTSGRDEYLPIPNAQVEKSKGVYIQNVGY